MDISSQTPPVYQQALRLVRPFLASLAAKEGRNPTFDFLKPTHPLFGYFNQLIEQYQRVLLPSQSHLSKIAQRAQPSSKWSMLEEAKSHATWQRKKAEREKKREEEEDEKLVREVFSKVTMPVASGSGSSEGSGKTLTVKRKAEGEEPDLKSLLPESTRELIASKSAAVPVMKKRKTAQKNSLGIKMKGKAPAKAVV